MSVKKYTYTKKRDMYDSYGKPISVDSAIGQGKPNREKYVYVNMKILLYAMSALAILGWVICEVFKNI